MKSAPIAATQKFFKKFGRLNRLIFWLFIAGIFVVLIVSGILAYRHFKKSNLDFSVKGPDQILLGVPFDIETKFTNNSQEELQSVKLSMVLPDGVSLTDADKNKKVFNKDLGSIKPGEASDNKITVVIFNGEGSKHFDFTATYYLGNLGDKVRFEKDRGADVNIKGPAVNLNITAPEKVLNSQQFELKIDYENVSETDFSSLQLEIAYPKIFTYRNANPKPTNSNNTWRIDKLNRKATSSIVLAGSVWGREGSSFNIKATLTSNGLTIGEKSITINVAPSPLSASITVQSSQTGVAYPGEQLNYIIGYKNNTDVALNDVTIRTTLSGEMFDINTLAVSGNSNISQNTITWNSNNIDAFRSLQPGAQGAVSFRIKVKPDYPIKRVSDKNFILKLGVEISSPTIPYYVATDRTVGVAESDIGVTDRVILTSKIFFNDPVSGIINTSTLPLQVGKPANFVVHLFVTNYSNDARNVQIKTQFLGGAKLVSGVTTNIISTSTYDPITGNLVWSIDRLPATKGVISNPAEAIFQIQAVPNVTELGQWVPLLNETDLLAVDDFTNLNLSATTSALTTQNLSDLGFIPSQGIVK